MMHVSTIREFPGCPKLLHGKSPFANQTGSKSYRQTAHSRGQRILLGNPTITIPIPALGNLPHDSQYRPSFQKFSGNLLKIQEISHSPLPGKYATTTLTIIITIRVVTCIYQTFPALLSLHLTFVRYVDTVF